MIHAPFMEIGPHGVTGVHAPRLVVVEKDTDTDHVPAHPLKMVVALVQDKRARLGLVACKCAPLMETGLIGAHGLRAKTRMERMCFVEEEVKKDSEHALIHHPNLEVGHALVTPCKRKNATLSHATSHLSKPLDRSLVTSTMKNLV